MESAAAERFSKSSAVVAAICQRADVGSLAELSARAGGAPPSVFVAGAREFFLANWSRAAEISEIRIGDITNKKPPKKAPALAAVLAAFQEEAKLAGDGPVAVDAKKAAEIAPVVDAKKAAAAAKAAAKAAAAVNAAAAAKAAAKKAKAAAFAKTAAAAKSAKAVKAAAAAKAVAKAATEHSDEWLAQAAASAATAADDNIDMSV